MQCFGRELMEVSNEMPAALQARLQKRVYIRGSPRKVLFPLCNFVVVAIAWGGFGCLQHRLKYRSI